MKETLVDTTVTYTLAHEGKVYIVEHVPARVSQETGEQYFEPETVRRIQHLIKEKRQPARFVSAPVYEYSDEADA